MTIDQAWRKHPGTRNVFAQHHLPSCDGCAVRFDETIAEAAGAYGLELGALLEELNALL
jgi:hybrid cluster-associated redox disulfide protein